VLAGQAHYHLSHSLFDLAILEIRFHFLAQASWTVIHLFYASHQCRNDKCTLPHPTFSRTEMGSSELVFAWTDLEL
jgi:hypothetical protein